MKKGFKIGLRILGVLLGLILIIGVWVFIDFKRNEKTVRVDAKGGNHYLMKTRGDLGHVYRQLEAGTPPEKIVWNEIYGTLLYMYERFDTADFRLPTIVRLLYKHGDNIPGWVMNDMKKTLTGYKYWQSYPGDDGVCYWSENHQLLFSSGEYLIGSYWPEAKFDILGNKGSWHAEEGKQRVLTWLDQRWKYGIVEWNSNVYYGFTVDPLLALIEFAPDEEVRVKASMILDLLMFDMASQSYQGSFVSTSGRAYDGNRVSAQSAGMKGVRDAVWPEFAPLDEEGNPMQRGENDLERASKYTLPPVIREIGLDPETAVIKASTGLNLTDLKGLDLIGTEDNQIMMQWAMESFSNPEIIDNTVDYLNEYDMFTNEFLYDLGLVNIGFLRVFNLLPTVSRILQPQASGSSIQRADTYMYRTPDYSMATAQAYHPGTYGDQHHLFSLTLNDTVSIFHTHPATKLGGGALGGSPGYWTGYGRIPHQVQDLNVNMAIYNVGTKKGFLESRLYDWTHYYLPERFLDEVVIEDNYAFIRHENNYIALIGLNDLFYVTRDFIEKKGDLDKSTEKNFMRIWGGRLEGDDGLSNRYDLIQEGRESFWITEIVNAADYSSFEAFKAEIKDRPLGYDEGILTFKNRDGQEYTLAYKGDFSIDGEVQDLEYDRINSPYGQVPREMDEMELSFNGKSLYLNFDEGIRRFN